MRLGWICLFPCAGLWCSALSRLAPATAACYRSPAETGWQPRRRRRIWGQRTCLARVSGPSTWSIRSSGWWGRGTPAEGSGRPDPESKESRVHP
uniref:Secreted protein n=1 Tax=Arundo donax TaxID=35708 RepID=A0A0A9CHU4_ARUDO